MAGRTRPAAPAPREDADPKAHAVHLICGDDEFRVAEEVRAVVDALCPPADRAFGLEIVSGACGNADEAVSALRQTLDAVRTLGFLGANKTVWLRDANIFHDNGPGKSEVVKAAVKALTAEIQRGLITGHRLVISGEAADRRTSFYKTVEKAGRVQRFDLPEKSYEQEQSARAFAESRLHAAGVAVRGQALEVFATRCGTDPRQIAQEVDKLLTYLGDRREVAADDVRAIVSPAREALGWDLADAVGARNGAEAVRLLRQLLFQKAKPTELMFAVEGRLRDMLVFRTCLDRGWLRLSGSSNYVKTEWVGHPEADALLSSLAQDPRTLHPYRAGRLATQALQYKPAELARSLQAATEAHEMMFSSPVPPETLLEVLLVRVIGKARHEAER